MTDQNKFGRKQESEEEEKGNVGSSLPPFTVICKDWKPSAHPVRTFSFPFQSMRMKTAVLQKAMTLEESSLSSVCQ